MPQRRLDRLHHGVAVGLVEVDEGDGVVLVRGVRPDPELTLGRGACYGHRWVPVDGDGMRRRGGVAGEEVIFDVEGCRADAQQLVGEALHRPQIDSDRPFKSGHLGAEDVLLEPRAVHGSREAVGTDGAGLPRSAALGGASSA